MKKDAAGNYLNVGDEIYYAKGNHLHRGHVEAITDKMIRTTSDRLVYPSDCIRPGVHPI